MVLSGKYSILVADESKGCREDLEDILKGEGHHAVLADCGARALQLLFSERIHLSILDMNLSDIPGLEVLWLLNRKSKQVPTIFLSSENSKEQQIQALNAGVETLILKPLDRRIVSFTVNHILEKLFEGGSQHFPYS